MSMNATAKAIATNAHVQDFKEVTEAGGQYGPWSILSIGPGPESFWFFGSNPAIFLPDGSIVQGMGMIRQIKQFALLPFNFGE